ncbi:MAG: [FeFe] hydrogenase H-cluster radical SAM maturase HydE [Clostridia bacterium]
MKDLIDKLAEKRSLSKEELVLLLGNVSGSLSEYLFERSRKRATEFFGNRIYTRGLIELTNHCKNDCCYCGIRRGNRNVDRYRLNKADILTCCEKGYNLGFRTFVLQGGEDPYYTDERLTDIISEIKKRYPDCAVTLFMGERSPDSYQALYDAGADRYLLRHETANPEHYARLHPREQNLEKRKECLWTLKRIGYQVGTGFMVGSPFQTVENLAEDLLFIQKLSPAMIGIGPFIPHHDTPFGDRTPGSLEMTLFMIGILRLMIPNAMIPATTALGTIHPQGRGKGVLAGANVVMPNLSPIDVRKKYELYDNKISTGEEAAEYRSRLQNRMRAIGYELVVDRGDFKPIVFQ